MKGSPRPLFSSFFLEKHGLLFETHEFLSTTMVTKLDPLRHSQPSLLPRTGNLPLTGKQIKYATDRRPSHDRCNSNRWQIQNQTSNKTPLAGKTNVIIDKTAKAIHCNYCNMHSITSRKTKRSKSYKTPSSTTTTTTTTTKKKNTSQVEHTVNHSDHVRESNSGILTEANSRHRHWELLQP